MGRTLPPLQEVTWIGRVTTDLLTKPRSPGSLSAPLSSKLERGHSEINGGHPVKSQLGGDQGRGRSDSMGVMAQAGGKPAAVSGLGTQPRDCTGDPCQVAPALWVPEVSFVK